jgi:hypothetical protein
MKANCWKLILLVVFISLPQLTSAQKYLFSKNYWHRGEITLHTGQTFVGFVRYHLNHNLVELKSYKAQFTKTFGSAQIEQFSIFDTLTKVERTFYTLPSSTQLGQSRTIFFELIGNNDFEVLTREKVVMKPHNKGLDLKGSGKYDLVLEDDFYYLDTNGKARSCGQVEELASIIEIPFAELRQYIKTNKLNMRQRTDFMSLINHFGAYSKLSVKDKLDNKSR